MPNKEQHTAARRRLITEVNGLPPGLHDGQDQAARLTESIRCHYGLRRVGVFKAEDEAGVMVLWAHCQGTWDANGYDAALCVMRPSGMLKVGSHTWLLPIAASVDAAIYLEALCDTETSWNPDDHDVALLNLMSKFIAHAIDHRRLISAAATFDSLTGLPNRAAWEQRISALLQCGSRPLAMLYLDLDHFRVINTECGHRAGDEFLRQVASLLSGMVRANTPSRLSDDMVARLSADEFAIILVGCSQAPAERRAEEFRAAIEEFRFQGKTAMHSVGVSIGLVVVDGAQKWDVEQIMRMSDSALSLAKHYGRNQTVSVQSDRRTQESIRYAAEWTHRITHAVSHNQFDLRRQRIQHLADPDRYAWEVLVTMVGENGELHSPGMFIDFAESAGLMPSVDRAIIRRAIEQFEQILGDAAYLTLNVSARSIVQTGFVKWLCQLIKSHRVDTSKLVFEITESAAIHSQQKSSEFIAAMRGLGCGIAIDDLGNGYAFELLRQLTDSDALPGRLLIKIAGNLVRDIVTNERNRGLVETVVKLAHTVGGECVAEWVEDAETLELLRAMGAGMVQGFHIHEPEVVLKAPPMPASALALVGV